jgi:hypothetical protein
VGDCKIQAIVVRAVAVSVVGKGNMAVEDPAARVTYHNPINDKNTTLLWMMVSTETICK